ncbi:hypothetical protein EUA06_18500 [Nocardioides glacieisoli]|uniref:EfeO-type cupredoxin-like domain-containing protein n=1 Tax=Nocardioides glacieisoli TaxID=1168730 RepID=A0A4Q2RK36_9ACTN|nr:hypothetical protein [Nocardioides glacieisoli]RYB89090.1 hypothetical protein EUA06_18500 [Nocardioides glacieisoli]
MPTEPTPTPTSPSSPSSSTPPDDASPSETPDDAGAELTVTRTAGQFTPNGERVELDVGETLTLTIVSDEAGSLHAHSTPEQTIDYGVGTTTERITIDRPGLVEVENHEPAVVVLQLEVR